MVKEFLVQLKIFEDVVKITSPSVPLLHKEREENSSDNFIIASST